MVSELSGFSKKISMNDEIINNENQSNLEEVFGMLDQKFLEEYKGIEVPSNLPDGSYQVIVTKTEVMPVQKPGGKTVTLKLSAKVTAPETAVGKIFQYDFTLNENNKAMMKKLFFALGFEYDLRNQFVAFSRLPGSELEINISTNGAYQNKNIRRVTSRGQMLTTFLEDIATGEEL